MLEGLDQNQKSVLRRFLWKIAIPREFTINFVVNSTIAFFVFRGRNDIGLIGWGGIAAMLIPMSVLLPFLTSFFGVFVGRIVRLGEFQLPKLEPGKAWVGFALAVGVRNSIVVLGSTIAILYSLDYFMPGIEMASWSVISGFGFGSASFAGVLHGRSICEAMRI